MPDFQLTKAQNQENIEQLVKLQILKNQARDLGLDVEKVFRLRNTVSVPEQIEVSEYITSENKTVNDKVGGLSYQEALEDNMSTMMANIMRCEKPEKSW